MNGLTSLLEESCIGAELYLEELGGFLTTIDQFIHAQRVRVQTSGTSAIASDELRLHVPLPDILYSSFIISVLSFVEREVLSICSLVQQPVNQKSGVQSHAQQLHWRKQLRHSLPAAHTDIDSRLWDDVNSAVAVRNCVVHHRGLLRDFSRCQLIQDFGARRALSVELLGYLNPTRKLADAILEIAKSFTLGTYRIAVAQVGTEDHRIPRVDDD